MEMMNKKTMQKRFFSANKYRTRERHSLKVISSMYGKHVADTSKNFKSSKGRKEFCILD
jgi:hypothetical protein